MKKNVLLAAALMLSASGFAQTTLWDGESYDLGSKGGCWDDGSPVVVENPEKDGINTSDKCLKFTMTGNDDNQKVVKIPFRDWIQPSMNGSYRVSLMIKKTTNENVRIELSDPTDGSDGYWKKVVAWYGGDGQWQKVVFDFSTNGAFDYPGVISITGQTGGSITEAADVYIDNVVIEPATKVNGQLLKDIADGSLAGNITLAGAWMKGDCQNADADWVANTYNDFEALKAKLSASATSIDMRGAVLKDAYNAFLDVNPNIVVFSDYYLDGDNVVADNTATKLVLDPAYPFGIPTGFNATAVELKRELKETYNTLYLPFFVSAEDLGAESVSTYSGSALNGETQSVTFTIAEDGVEANTPMLVKMAETAAEAEDEPGVITFNNKFVKELSDTENNGAFYGVYAPQSATGLWGLGNGVFIKGGDGATINAFSAYLKFDGDGNNAKSVVFSSTTGTGVSSVTANNARETVDVYSLSGMRVLSGVNAADAVRNLAKGLYIINGKKVVVK